MAAIEVRDVWKKYRLYHDKGSTLKEKILFRNRSRFDERWVLKGVNTSIDKGDTVGLIGENGSGKSTLLKLLTRITYPNKGDIIINGKVSSLLELGAGFHPDMTGRENIYINASIFGLTREEIDSKLQNIISFSELENYIDSPVRTYSSGMYMRLAFSVAINVDADILLIDEILAVGDVNFQNKCFHKMQQLKKDGVTIVLVSHDLESVEKLCNKVIWLNEGKVEAAGDAVSVCRQYLHFMLTKDEQVMLQDAGDHDPAANTEPGNMQQPIETSDITADVNTDSTNVSEPAPEGSPKKQWGNKWVEITDAALLDKQGDRHLHFNTDEPLTIRIRYRINKRPATIGFGFAINRADGIYCYGTNTFIDGIGIAADELPDEGEVLIHIDSLGLIAGNYNVDIAIHDKDGIAFDYRKGLIDFSVYSDMKDEGLYRLPHQWQLQ